MIDKFLANEWKIIEEGFDPGTNRFSESIFSLGNEHMGLRGFFEETYSGDSLQGIYVAGVYYPDKTRVGWWKIGYPEFFAKVINSTNWIGVNVEVEGKNLDLAKCTVKNFQRELDMKQGKLTRSFTWVGEDGKETAFVFTRFLSMAENNLACVSVQVTPLNYDGKFSFTPYLDGDVKNEDANYGEIFWDELGHRINADEALLTMKTKKTGFVQTTAAAVKVLVDGAEANASKEQIDREKYVGYRIAVSAKKGSTVTLQKFVSVCTSRDEIGRAHV